MSTHSELAELYQEMLLDHGRTPRNFGVHEHADRSAEGTNPLCGDELTVTLLMEGDTIADLRFEGSGCAISTASASIMTQLLKGKTTEEAKALFHTFHELVAGEGDPQDPSLGKLAIFSGVRRYPMRVKCATLAWHTLNAAIDGTEDPITTE